MTDQTRNSDQANLLSGLARASAADLKALAESLLPELEARGSLGVTQNRTGLVMLPYRDTVQGTVFHLGEVLVAEAQVSQGDTLGYGVLLGRDLEAALGMALVDLAWQTGVGAARIQAFLETAQHEQALEDSLLAGQIEATRVQMETF
jgi:alpha-D-ribose 1-methylphosphonate 5-triphosphate synthase subunit PhnG